ncbi:mitochondrial fusion and transport protein Ugo1 [Sodiomyces alkalinus F11]|uniref:Mitochondrial fusion and transport protein Ugo1 n=1 Tax=Sodiomyces alkalinus (strain CBS 110278 / VKM F-3762 / F11) TaxID=1314773 RepID=A0A3N2PX00_SODAK|nr:mitochondrial fusion and transport protein Ugo1 [Sodiomyces alkalinus F11]ROT39059.1 mitochondrial fusion and transport protein Ugo1 [Sodiomyces alkalinus F11]
MSSHREGVNPLRPYYIPPTIGESPDPTSSPIPNPFSRGNAPGDRYASKARDLFSDLDYKEYINEPSSSAVETLKELIDELLWKYTSVLMAQPFEVAKTVLQVRSYDEDADTITPAITPLPTPTAADRAHSGYGHGHGHDSSTYGYADSDSDADEPAYFTSHMPGTPTPSQSQRGRRNRQDPSFGAAQQPSRSSPKSAAVRPHQLNLRLPDSVTEAIGQLWQKEGAWGVWKGSNATFLYTVLTSVLENWSRSALSALFNVPDLGVKDDIDRLIDIASPYPWASLGVAAAAAVATGLILAPLDMVRTRLLVTPSSKGPRRTLSTLRALPSYLCPPGLVVPTILHSLVHPLLTLSTPLVLRTRFMIDSQISPTTFSVAKFFASSAAVFAKLPVETVLRRGQVAILSSAAYMRALQPQEKDARLDTVVPPGRYDGVTGTMFHIVNEEGRRVVAKPAPAAKSGRGKAKAKAGEAVYRQGQGLDGLWRGWKVSWWGLVGLWAAGVIGNSAEGEF